MVGSPLIFGGAFDEALNAMLLKEGDAEQIFIDKLSNPMINGVVEDLYISDKVKYSKSDFDIDVLGKMELAYLDGYLDGAKVDETWYNLTDGHELSTDDKDVYNHLCFLSLKCKGVEMLRAYREQVIPRIKRIIAVQRPVSLKNEDGDEFIGVVDLVCEWEDGREIIFDNKTSSRPYKDESVGTSPQLATYQEALMDEFNTPWCGYIVIPKTIRKKKLPKVPIQVIIGQVDEKTIADTFKTYDKVNTSIRAGEFVENRHACINEYKQKCPYYDYCRSGNKAGLVDLGKKDK